MDVLNLQFGDTTYDQTACDKNTRMYSYHPSDIWYVSYMYAEIHFCAGFAEKIVKKNAFYGVFMKKRSKTNIFTVILVLTASLVFITSCVSPQRQLPPVMPAPEEQIPEEPTLDVISIFIAARGVCSPSQLTAFFMANNPNADRAKVQRMAQYYVAECAVEGINSDVAFCQMCLETGFLRFGGLVTEDMNNFCGLGSIDAEHPGNSFATEELGVRAHVQHLHAYGTTGTLVQECIDPRYKWVTPRGKAPTIYELAGTWAADRQYGEKLAVLLSRLALM